MNTLPIEDMNKTYLEHSKNGIINMGEIVHWLIQ